MIIESQFTPAWWMRNQHLQTILPRMIRSTLLINTIYEQLELPDGDFLELAWTEKFLPNTTKPIVIVLHGLGGSIDSFYIQGILKQIKQQGWIGVLMHFRGCGYQTNRLARSYHSGETGDIGFLIQTIRQRAKKAPLFAVGYSLGGNVLAKYLGESGHWSLLSGACVICAPFHLASCVRQLNRGFSRIYQHYLLGKMKKATIHKLKIMQQNFPLAINIQDIKAFNSIHDFDDQVTAPLHGFAHSQELYQLASGLSYLISIKVPTLIIHAQDDPFLTDQVIPTTKQLSSDITYELCRGGGHVGFISGLYPSQPLFWLEQRIPEFLNQLMIKKPTIETKKPQTIHSLFGATY